MKLSEKLTERLRSDLGLKVVFIERVQRGKWGKAAGTYSWIARLEDGTDIGSEDTMLTCVRAKSLGLLRPAVQSLDPQVCANN